MDGLYRSNVWFCVAGLLVASGASGQTTRVSVAADGTEANGSSHQPAISADGRYVAFASTATNLIAGDTNMSADVFVKDRQTGAVYRVSVASDGTERTGDSGLSGVDISDDGMVVAFASRAAFVSDDTNTCPANTSGGVGSSCADIYVHNRATGHTIRASVGINGQEPDLPSADPVLNVDGRLVAFTSEATNLVIGDTNTSADIFLRDHTASTTSRVSVTSAGNEAAGASFAPSLSGDGDVVAFLSNASGLSSVPDPELCGAVCTRAYVHVRSTRTTSRLSMPPQPSSRPPSLRWIAAVDITVSTDGRSVLQATYHPLGAQTRQTEAVYHDLETGDSEVVSTADLDHEARATMSGNGRHVAIGHVTEGLGYPMVVVDRLLKSVVSPERVPPVGALWVSIRGTALNRDGRFVVFNAFDPFIVAGDLNNASDVFVFDRDSDEDGIFSDWEREFGFDPLEPADAALDNDSDGRTNLQEYQDNTHPKGTFRQYIAEGAENAFFTTTVALMNPNGARVPVSVQYLGAEGTHEARWLALDPLRRVSHAPASATSLQHFSMIVESSLPIVADRHMTWGSGPRAGAHGETAIQAPSTSWYLAEGATHGAFDLFYLLENPTASDAQVTIEYLRPAPLPAVIKSYDLSARSRRTIWVDDQGPELEASDLSARITSDQPIVVERSMYFSTAAGPFIAGHSGAGVTAPATRWFLAEGATGAFFDMYLLIANPGDVKAAVTVTYLLPEGPAVVKTYEVEARSRTTIWVEGEDARLANTTVSATVESTNGQAVVVERAMWWPYTAWHGSHVVAGATAPATRWAFADGAVDLSSATGGAETFVLIANTSDQAGSARVRLIFGDGAPVESEMALPPASRTTVRIAEIFAEADGQPFGVIVDSSVPVVVERTHYITDAGVVWTAGYAALATKLP